MKQYYTYSGLIYDDQLREILSNRILDFSPVHTSSATSSDLLISMTSSYHYTASSKTINSTIVLHWSICPLHNAILNDLIANYKINKILYTYDSQIHVNIASNEFLVFSNKSFSVRGIKYSYFDYSIEYINSLIKDQKVNG